MNGFVFFPPLKKDLKQKTMKLSLMQGTTSGKAYMKERPPCNCNRCVALAPFLCDQGKKKYETIREVTEAVRRREELTEGQGWGLGWRGSRPMELFQIDFVFVQIFYCRFYPSVFQQLTSILLKMLRVKCGEHKFISLKRDRSLSFCPFNTCFTNPRTHFWNGRIIIHLYHQLSVLLLVISDSEIIFILILKRAKKQTKEASSSTYDALWKHLGISLN